MHRLSPEARAAGHRLHVHDRLASTNAEALARAQGGETGPLWIVARHQSAGRGRRGSAWISPEGNLAASLLLPIADVAPERVATLGFAAGLALALALDDVAGRLHAGEDGPQPLAETGERGFRLKWPNDVTVDGAKLAGLLLEAEGRRAAVVGFGVNVARAPEGLPVRATALGALGIAADAEMLFTALTARFVETLRIWNKGRGFSGVRRRWLARAAGLRAPIAVRTHGGTLSGLHGGIDEEGRLMILAPDGTTRTVTAGEVHFGEAATAA